MTPEAEDTLEKFFGAFAGAHPPLLLLDYDGTLSPFRVDRFKARPYVGVPGLLTRIQKQGQTRIAIITGRPAKEVAPLLGLKSPIEVWGLHGAERLYPDGRRELEAVSDLAEAKLNDLKAQLQQDSFGGLLEDKDNGIVMHWRGAAPSKARRIQKRTRALFEPLACLDGLEMVESEACLELRAGRDKGGAVEAILQESSTFGSVAFLGDDLTDESAFRALKGRGLSILVRRHPRETEADIHLCPPREVKQFLKLWLAALPQRRAPRPRLPAN